jgi:hypothetical protein
MDFGFENKRKLKLLEDEEANEHVVGNQNRYNRQKVKPTTKTYASGGVDSFSLFPNILNTSNIVGVNFDMMHQIASKAPHMGERRMKIIYQAVGILKCAPRVSPLDAWLKSFIIKYKQKISSSDSKNSLLIVKEAIVVLEGLTPESEQVFVFHELIDVL